MLILCHHDDKKEKPFSHECFLKEQYYQAIEQSKRLDLPITDLIGYGENKEEALKNLREQIQNYFQEISSFYTLFCGTSFFENDENINEVDGLGNFINKEKIPMITMEPRTIRVKAKRPELLPQQAHDGEWYDLCSDKELRLKEGDYGSINLGVCIEVPVGYEAHLQPRSSTFKKYGIIQTNSPGIIDNRYKGDNDWWLLPFYATREAIIPAGARIAQFKVVPQQEYFNIAAVIKMGNEDRGGLGSTGV